MTSKLQQFIKGMGSAIDLGATSGPIQARAARCVNLERTCAEALGEDWHKLAEDFNSAFSDTVKDGRGHGKQE